MPSHAERLAGVPRRKITLAAPGVEGRPGVPAAIVMAGVMAGGAALAAWTRAPWPGAGAERRTRPRWQGTANFGVAGRYAGMTDLHASVPHLAFLLLALLAGAVVALAATRAPLSAPLALNLGALVFLGQFGAFVVLAGLAWRRPWRRLRHWGWAWWRAWRLARAVSLCRAQVKPL
jgi:hypothetical protein